MWWRYHDWYIYHISTMYPYSFLLNNLNTFPPLLHSYPPGKRVHQVMVKLLQEEPTQPSFLLPGIIYLQVANQPLASHPHPLSSLWMSSPSSSFGTPPMRATILPNQITSLAFHGRLEWSSLETSHPWLCWIHEDPNVMEVTSPSHPCLTALLIPPMM